MYLNCLLEFIHTFYLNCLLNVNISGDLSKHLQLLVVLVQKELLAS